MFTYENQGVNTYLVYQFQQNDEIDKLSIGMISNNVIKGVAPLVITQMDERKLAKYNVSSMVSLKQLFSGMVNKKQLVDVFKNICQTMIEVEEYMLDTDSFLWDTEYIFANVSTHEIAMVCVPVLGNKEPIDVKLFFKQIMFDTKFDDPSYVGAIVNFLNGSELFTMESFQKELEAIEKDSAVKVTTKANVAKTVQQTPQASPAVQQSVVQQPVQKNVAQPVPQQNNNGYSVAKVVEKQEQMKAEQEAAVAQELKSSSFGIPSLSKKPSELKQSSRGGLFKKSEKRVEEKSGGLFGGKKKSKEAPSVSAMSMSPGFKVPGAGPSDVNMLHSPAPSSNVQAQSMKMEEKQFAQPAPQSQPVVTSTLPQPQVASKPANFGATTVLDTPQNGATTVLDASMMPGASGVAKPYLLRKRNNETIPVDKTEFRIGKERSFVDYFIGDNTSISRSHANIICRGNEYFVVDTNSTNHTFVNDVMIQSNLETKIESGAKIRLADEEFEFKLM